MHSQLSFSKNPAITQFFIDSSQWQIQKCWRGKQAKDSVGQPCHAFVANAHNKLRAFYTGKGDLAYWKKLRPIWGVAAPSGPPFEFATVSSCSLRVFCDSGDAQRCQRKSTDETGRVAGTIRGPRALENWSVRSAADDRGRKATSKWTRIIIKTKWQKK